MPCAHMPKPAGPTEAPPRTGRAETSGWSAAFASANYRITTGHAVNAVLNPTLARHLLPAGKAFSADCIAKVTLWSDIPQGSPRWALLQSFHNSSLGAGYRPGNATSLQVQPGVPISRTGLVQARPRGSAFPCTSTEIQLPPTFNCRFGPAKLGIPRSGFSLSRQSVRQGPPRSIRGAHGIFCDFAFRRSGSCI